MVLDTPIANLLLRWEQLRAQGQLVTPEELCRECPELLEDLVKGLCALQTFHTLHGTPQESAGSTRSAPVQPMPPGLPAVGDYQILGELGHGGMGIIYQAYDRRRRQMIALKTLQRVDASALYRLKQEFRALAEVTHPNLVGLYDLISTGHQCFIAMELIDGDHFLAYIRSGAGVPGYQTVDATQASELKPGIEDAAIPAGAPYALAPAQYDRVRASLRQLTEGISALHAYGKLHRDIKPSNVLVTREGRVVLLDFGLAAELDWAGVHQSTEQHVTGTIAYMAPEQAASQPQSPASDWYSVGVMLFEALTGRLPFAGTPFQVLMDKQKREPPLPSKLVPNVPADLDSLCGALLRRAPEARPSTQEVLQRLGSGTARQAPTAPILPSRPVQKAAFVGRERHQAELTDAFQAMRQGRTVVVRVAGRSGTGKSMLAQRFLDELDQRGAAVVLAGKCYERESVPYKALDSLVDALSRYLRRLPPLEVQALLPREVQLLARVFPVLQRVAAVADAPGRAAEIHDPHDLRRRAFGALRELLARLGDRKPLILFIDDLQWGDLDGANQLAELIRPPTPPALLLLVCYRSEDADSSPCLGIVHWELEKAGAALDQRLLAIDPLTHQEARALVLTLLGRHDSASQSYAEAIARESGGNPFFVHVLVQCLAAEGTNVDPSLLGNLTLDQVLWARIQSLPAAAQHLLEVIAVSGQPMRLVDASQAVGYGAEEHGALAVLRSGRLIRSAGSPDVEEVETYHDRVRETTLNHLSTDAAANLHRRIAMVLESSATTDPKLDAKRRFDLAYHFDAGGESVRALPYALSLAERARAQYALEKAEQLYRIAERGAEKADPAVRYQVAENLGEVLMLRGSYPEAATRFQAALALTTDLVKRAETQGKLAELAFKRGDMKTAIEATEQALRMLDNRVPRWSIAYLFSLLWETVVQSLHTLIPQFFLARRKVLGAEKELLSIRLHNRLTYCYWFGRGKVSCLWSHLRGMNLAERYPPTLELAQAYSIHAPVMSLIPYLSRGIVFAQKSFAIYHSLGDIWGQGQSSSFHGMVLYVGARFEEALQKFREAARLLERTGDSWEVNIAHTHIANSLYRMGDLVGAITEARRVHQAGVELGDTQALGICLDVWARASGGQVPQETLRTELQRPRADVQVSAQVMLAEGVRLFMLDRVEEAAVVFESGHRLAVGAGVKNAWTVSLRPWLASALRRQAEKALDSHLVNRSVLLKRAAKVARRACRTARTFSIDLPHALRERGLIAAALGRIRQALRCLDESLAVAERQGARFEYAQTQLARGRIGRQHDWLAAEQDVTAARQTLHELGAYFAVDDAATP